MVETIMMDKVCLQEHAKLQEKVGRTPLYEIQNIEIPNGNRVFAKEEWVNPTGSMFDRIYPHLFQIAEEEGKIIPGVTPVVEASTGNAGASFAWCARQLGYDDCTVIIHEDAPRARIEQIRRYGAKIIFSPAGQYTKGYVQKLEDVLREDKKAKGGKIGENPKRLYCVTKINPRAREVYQQFVEEVIEKVPTIDYFVGVVGSGTSISGIGKYLKDFNSITKIIAVDPEETPSTHYFKYEHKTIDYCNMPHNIFGGATFGLTLDKLNLDLDLIDEIRFVNKQEREEAFNQLSKNDQKEVGRTSCCVFATAQRLAEEVRNKNILICFYDLSWKYS
jgi:cysteine synthase A